MIDPEDRYWGGVPGRSWADASVTLRTLPVVAWRPTGRPNLVSKALWADMDRIAPCEVPESNALMERLGLRTRYRADGQPYLVDDEAEAA